MQKLFAAFLFSGFFILFTGSHVIAQDAYHADIERVKLPADAYFITDFFAGDKSSVPVNEARPPVRELDDLQKELMLRINDIYEMHIQSVRAQIEDRPVEAEEQITKTLTEVKQLLEEYPEVQGNERFTELYRTVYTEYRSFYGIEDENREKGEVFEVQRELYEKENDWMKGRYVLPEDITTPETVVPLIRNDQVNRHLAFYSKERPEIMDSWLKRSKKYFPMMRRIFREEGTPTELVHLSMIESGLNPLAESWASAVGMWQFIEATGSAYGLEVNWWVDERRDPEKATRAAARHLLDLYNVWGDWHLALANYNISPRGLKRAIRAGGGKQDYWSAYPHLPRETQGYIPGFIATTIINRNAATFGFKNSYTVETYRYDTAEVEPLMSLDKLAAAANISTDQLKELNPELLRWATPPGSKYELKLPDGAKRAFLANYRKIPDDERGRGVAMHTVRRGETLGKIAGRYGSSVRILYESNEGLTSTIHPGQKIMVPLAPGSSGTMAANETETDAEETPSTNTASTSTSTSASTSTPQPSETDSDLSAVDYTVKSGDTIGHIAEWFDVHASQIRTWNNTSNRITVGERLTMYVPGDKKNYYRQIESFSASKKQQIEYEQRRGKNVTTLYLAEAGTDDSAQYVVQKNDTLIGIAQTFGISVSQLKRANNLNNSEIYEGQRLTIKQ